MRLKANKTSLYKLVGLYQPLPKMKDTRFSKIPRERSYILSWFNSVLGENCRANFSVAAGRPFLGLTIGVEWHCVNFTAQELKEHGMIDMEGVTE
jgi:hypothetical protein